MTCSAQPFRHNTERDRRTYRNLATALSVLWRYAYSTCSIALWSCVTHGLYLCTRSAAECALVGYDTWWTQIKWVVRPTGSIGYRKTKFDEKRFTSIHRHRKLSRFQLHNLSLERCDSTVCLHNEHWHLNHRVVVQTVTKSSNARSHSRYKTVTTASIQTSKVLRTLNYSQVRLF